MKQVNIDVCQSINSRYLYTYGKKFDLKPRLTWGSSFMVFSLKCPDKIVVLLPLPKLSPLDNFPVYFF